MPKSDRPPAIPYAFATRPGEGALVDVVISHATDVGGQSSVLMSLDISNAPAPERKYAADTCSVLVKGSTVKLLFGQQRVSGGGLRSMVVIHMTPNGVQQFLGSVAQVKDPSFADIAKRESIKPDELPKALEEPPPGQTVGLTANLLVTAVSGDAACIDFYQASPFVMTALARAPKKMALDPVVRVDLATSLFFGLVTELQKIARSFPPVPHKKKDQS